MCIPYEHCIQQYHFLEMICLNFKIMRVPHWRYSCSDIFTYLAVCCSLTVTFAAFTLWLSLRDLNLTHTDWPQWTSGTSSQDSSLLQLPWLYKVLHGQCCCILLPVEDTDCLACATVASACVPFRTTPGEYLFMKPLFNSEVLQHT